MTILFTPVGTTDPVRGFRDGAMLHILRHYPVDKIYVWLTKEMEENEERDHRYSEGIRSVCPDLEIEWIRSGLENPQRYGELTVLQKDFDDAYRREGKETRWLLNVSSGTPQMKTVMALLAIDYDRTKAIQVNSPEGKSNVGNDPNRRGDMVDMLAANEDEAADALNRCVEPELRLLRKYGIRLQIESLTENYEYGGALEILSQNRALFSKETEKLLRHAVLRENLQWKEANKMLTHYKEEQLLPGADTFAEYFRVMWLRQKKGRLADFIVKLSPVLMGLGEKYLEKCKPGFDIACCGYRNKWTGAFLLKKQNIAYYRPALLAELDTAYLPAGFRDNKELSFDVITYICEYLKTHEKRGDDRHTEITECFTRLRFIEQYARNSVAHTMANWTEADLKNLTDRDGRKIGMSSEEIIRTLQKAARLVLGKEISFDYDRLNRNILDSLKEE